MGFFHSNFKTFISFVTSYFEYRGNCKGGFYYYYFYYRIVKAQLFTLFTDKSEVSRVIFLVIFEPVTLARVYTIS